jgi:phosphate starvation-inducible PhoH-like protein
MKVFLLYIMIVPMFGFLKNMSRPSVRLFASKKNRIMEKEEKQLYLPKTANQELYVSALRDPSVHILLGVGPAGTGKTLFACSQAIQELNRGSIQKIIFTRPVVPVEEDIGFLPGSIINKMDPWTRPLFDVFMEYYPKGEIDSMVRNGIIEICPLAYMRGRTFKKSFIIADEMQNSSPNQMMMVTTRIGSGSKMVITGDLKQTDKPGDLSGLKDFIKRLENYNDPYCGIQLVKFGSSDVLRSYIVTKVLELYSDKENYNADVKASVKVEDKAVQVEASVEVEEDTHQKQMMNDCALIPIQHQSKFFNR